MEFSDFEALCPFMILSSSEILSFTDLMYAFSIVLLSLTAEVTTMKSINSWMETNDACANAVNNLANSSRESLPSLSTSNDLMISMLSSHV